MTAGLSVMVVSKLSFFLITPSTPMISAAVTSARQESVS